MRRILLAYGKNDVWNGQACVDYLAGAITETEFMNEAAGRFCSLANVHFNIAMMSLAEKSRAKAHQHFRKCVETCAAGSMDYEMARAYLTRMDADPQWPFWLDTEAK